MLTASFPGETAEGDWFKWEAHSKDHQISDPAQLAVYAIGIRLRFAPAGSPGVQNFIQIATGGGLDDPSGPLTDVHKPEITVPGPPLADWPLTGGGAFDMYGNGPGNMLMPAVPPASKTRDGLPGVRII